MKYLVINNEFNRTWCRELIGKEFTSPPSYCYVKPVASPEEKAGLGLAIVGFVGIPVLIAAALYFGTRRR